MPRDRITITLNRNVLALVDKFIESSRRIRNRSHAIEYILTKGLASTSSKALILAGGRGMEIKEKAKKREIPKAMLEIKGKPLLEHTIESLVLNKFKEIYIAISKKDSKIKDYFKNGQQFNLNIQYLEDKSTNEGTVRPLVQAKEYLKKEDFFVIHGDVMAKIDYKDLLKFHRSHKGLATVALTSVKKPTDWGIAEMRGNRIVQFKEKPKTKAKSKSHLVNAGIYIFKPKIFDYLDPQMKNLSAELFPDLAQKGELYGYVFEDTWYDVGDKEFYREAVGK